MSEFPVVVDSFGAQIIGSAMSEAEAVHVLNAWLRSDRPEAWQRVKTAKVCKVLMSRMHPDHPGRVIQAWLAEEMV